MDLAKKQTHYHHGSLKEALIDLAIKHLGEGLQPQDLSIRSLATELGVSVAAPYRHFPDANSLLASIACKGFVMLTAAMEHGLSRDLSELGQVYLSFALQYPNLYRVMYWIPQEDLRLFPDLASAAEKSYKLLTLAVRDLHIAKGKQNLPEALAVLAAWGYIHGIAELAIKKLAGPLDFTNQEVQKSLTQALIEGL
jgi:AcrR family transcriptional regulator